MLENPEVILAHIRQELEDTFQPGDASILKSKITTLKRRVKNYDAEEKRLIQLFRYGEISKNSVLDELNKLKEERKVDEECLEQLIHTHKQSTNLAKAEIKLNEFCERVSQNLDHCTLAEKRLALDALAVTVEVSQDRIELKGIIPVQISNPKTQDVTYH